MNTTQQGFIVGALLSLVIIAIAAHFISDCMRWDHGMKCAAHHQPVDRKPCVDTLKG